MVDKQTWTSIKSKEKVKEKEKARASKEKESQTGNPIMEKEEDTKAEDVASKEEEKAVVLVAVLEKVVESTIRKEVTGKVFATIARSLDTMKLNAD